MLIIFQPPSPDHGPGLQKCIENLAVEKFAHKLAVERFHTSVFPEATGHVGEGLKGLLKEGGSSRRAAVEKIINSMGGKLETFYYAFGETDLYAIADMPDNVDVAAFALTVAASGAVTLKTTVLMTREEIDKAVKKAPGYRPPGK